MRYVNPKDYGYVSQYVPLNLEIINDALKGKQSEQDKKQALIDDTESKILNVTDGYRTQGHSKKINEEFKPMFDELRNIDLTSAEAATKIKGILSKARTHTGLQTVLQDYSKGNPLYDKYSQEKNYENAVDPNKDINGNLNQIPYGEAYKPYDKAIEYVDNEKDWLEASKEITPKLNAWAKSDINWDDHGYIVTTNSSGKTQRLDIDDPSTAKQVNGLIQDKWLNGQGTKYWKAKQEQQGLSSDYNEFAKQFLHQARTQNKNNVIDANYAKHIEGPNENTLAARKKAESENTNIPDSPIARPISSKEAFIETTSTAEWEQGTTDLKTSLSEEQANLDKFTSNYNLIDANKQPVFEIQMHGEQLTVVPKANATAEQIATINGALSEDLIGFETRINNKQDQIKERENLIRKTKEYSGFDKDYKPKVEAIALGDLEYQKSLISNLDKKLNINLEREREITEEDLKNPSTIYFNTTTGYKTKKELAKLYNIQEKDLNNFISNGSLAFSTTKSNQEILKEAIKNGANEKDLKEIITLANEDKIKKISALDPKTALYEKNFQSLSEKNLVPEDGYRLGDDEKSIKHRNEIEATAEGMINDSPEIMRSFDGNIINTPENWKELKPEEKKLTFQYWKIDNDNNIVYGMSNPNINDGVSFEIKDIKNTDAFLVKTGKLSQVKGMYLQQLNSSMMNEGDTHGYIGFGNNKAEIERALFTTQYPDGTSIQKGQYRVKLPTGKYKTYDNKKDIIEDYMDYNAKLSNGIDILKNYLTKSDDEILKSDLPTNMKSKAAIQLQIDALKEKLEGVPKKVTPQSSQDNPLGI